MYTNVVDREIIILAHNIRSCHNVGSLFRTCDGFGVKSLILSGYSPYPKKADNDDRLPHIADKLTADIHKTALGSEEIVSWQHFDNPLSELKKLQSSGYSLIGLEQTASSVNLPDFKVPDKSVLILGEEVDGINSDLLSACQHVIEIPMQGQKESFNVAVAAAIALYHFRFSS